MILEVGKCYLLDRRPIFGQKDSLIKIYSFSYSENGDIKKILYLVARPDNRWSTEVKIVKIDRIFNYKLFDSFKEIGCPTWNN